MALNLFTNAIKFTEDGGRINVRLERDDDCARLTIADTGIGIPEAEQAQMFDRFHRGSNAQRLAIPGTGLGLGIVHSIATHHGGEVLLTSAEGSGTTLVVDLPLSGACDRSHP